MNSENKHTDLQCTRLLEKIFNGYAGFLKKLVPKGWKNSEYVLFYHPTAKQQYEENKMISENISKLGGNKKKQMVTPLSKFKQDLKNVDEEIEPIELLGLCLWDIFSKNHSVIDANGKEYDLGSFRGSGGFIADVINETYNDKNKKNNFDYIDFFTGSLMIGNRGNTQPFYEYIFTVLKKEKCNWIYSFPRMGLISFEDDEPVSPENYDPAMAMEKEIEKKKVKEFQKQLDDSYNESYEEAKYKEPPKTVLAYLKIYGELPEGHPQKGI